MSTIGFDIGGANLKAVFLPESDSEDARAVEVAFEMWTRSAELPEALQAIVDQVDPDAESAKIAVTMTGELADCFSSKKEGVAFISDAVRKIADKKPVSFYQVDGQWASFETVERNWQLVAASNWHAMAKFGARFLPNRSGLIIDVGSTTTDVTPVIAGTPQAIGTTDFTRLKNFELIYAGIGRTPICSLIQSVDVGGQKIGLARELFATIHDALIYSGLVPEDSNDKNSADGRSNSLRHVKHRLARMVCSDVAEIDSSLIGQIANGGIEAYRQLLTEAIDHALQRSGNSIASVLLVGSGSIFAERVLAERFPQLSRVAVSNLLSPSANTCGPAYAVAALLQGFDRAS